MKKPTAIILGGTFPHSDLIIKLKKRGYYTILIDYYENSIAKECAHVHIQESTLDKDAVLIIAKKYNAKLVISAYIDQANVTACYVSEKLDLPCPYSYDTALLITNKQLMKQRMLEHGIPTSKYYSISSIEDIADVELKFPVIVKPADSNSSKGVYKVLEKKELSKFIMLSLKYSRNEKAIVEEFIEGEEVGVDCFIKNKKATILITKVRRKIKVLEDKVQQIYGCFWPAELPVTVEIQFKEIAEKIAKAFNLDNCPLMIQAMVSGTEINVIEFAGRFGGGESFRIIERITGFDTTEATIDSFLKEPVDVNIVPSKYIYAENFIYSNKGIFDKIEGFDALLENKTIEYIDSLKTPGTLIGEELSSNNRVGVFVAKSNTKKDLLNKIKTTIDTIEVYDDNKTPIMRRDIYNIE